MGAVATASQRAQIRALGVVTVALAVGVLQVVTLASTTGTAGLLGDLEIYRGAIQYALDGGDLYAWVYEHPTVHGLGFTYPPFAALVLLPLTLVDLVTAKVLWTIVTYAVAVALLYVLVSRSAGLRGARSSTADRGAVRVAWVAGLAVPFMFSYPFLHNLVVGQVSLFVIALALCDHLLPRRWQGTLVGLAAAIKLTPLVFLPYYVITRQWRQAAVSAGVFAGATGLAFALSPTASISYWTDKLWQTGRVGRTDSTVNKSLLGFLDRLLPDGVTLVWLVVCAAVAVLAYWRASRHFRDGSPLAASLAVGALSVAVSPISWPHHQLWLVLAAAWYLLLRGRTAIVLGLGLFAVFAAYPWFADHPPGTVGPLLAAGVELPALAVLAVLGFGLMPGRGVPVEEASADLAVSRD